MTSDALSKLPTPTDLAVQWAPLTEMDLELVVAIEKQCYSHPWSLGNFKDALKAGNWTQGLKTEGAWIGYYVAMSVLDEVHLLNITVAPAFQRQGWARCLMQALSLCAHTHQATSLWLEVRQSNARALKLYTAFGFEQVGVRKDYYPAGRNQREAAVVMRLALNSSQ